jgi:hypothetical protein
MGNLNSTARLTEPVTLPRIWSACQYESSMPPELSKFTIELLADDMNKLGANIPTSGSRDSICRAIHDYLPQAEKVCMVGKDSVSKDKVYRMVELFNNQYGSRIPLYKNGYDGTDGYRPVADLCDDMYSVQKRVTRSLEKNTLEVKAKLINSISQLRAQQTALDAEFANYRNLLTKGKNLDTLRADIRSDLANQQKVVMNMKQQQAVLNSMYGQFIAGIKPVTVANASASLPPSILMSGGGKNSRDTVDAKYVGKLLTSTLNTGVAQQQVLDCFRNMGTTYEEYIYHASQPDGELERWIKQKEYEAKIDPVNADIISQSVIGSCAVALVDQKKQVLAKEYVANEFKGMAADSCSAHNKFPHPELRLIECNRDQLCSWINGSCQLADQKRNGPSDTADRYINFNQYTIRALGALREVVSLVDKTRIIPGNDCVVYSNNVDDIFVRKLFTEIFNKKVAVFDSLGRMVETSSADYEGTKVTKYMPKIYDDMILGYARFLIRTYDLNVIIDKGQDTLLAEAFSAYIKNNTVTKKIVRSANILPSYDEWVQSLTVYAESPELTQILNKHNMVVSGFLNPWA